MPIGTDLWTVTATPHPLPDAQLATEKKLEDMIVDAPRLLSDEWWSTSGDFLGTF